MRRPAEFQQLETDRTTVRLGELDVRQPDAAQRTHRLQALRRNVALLLNRPTPPPLAPRDQLDPLTASAHTISRMSALCFTPRLARLVVHHHGQHASHHHRVPQCGLNAPLTAISMFDADCAAG
jgi:hypothetical protein